MHIIHLSISETWSTLVEGLTADQWDRTSLNMCHLLHTGIGTLAAFMQLTRVGQRNLLLVILGDSSPAVDAIMSLIHDVGMVSA